VRLFSCLCAYTLYHDLTNEELMLKYGDDDIEAFNVLYERNKAPLYRYFLRQTSPGTRAEELAQDVWTNIIRNRKNYSQKAKFTTFLFQVARNRLIDHYRRNKNRPHNGNSTDDDLTPIPANQNSQPEQQTQSQQQMIRLLSLVRQLPEQQRDVFLLKEEAGLNLNDIAAVTGVNVETAKSRLRYAMAKLREGMGL
jgi:RNA polymerase sigma-70 factor (ECF subfamily)